MDIYFLLLGWGIGFEWLKQLQVVVNLVNVFFVGWVEDFEFEMFLVCVDFWIIFYCKDVVGVLVLSWFYNFLVVGCLVVLVFELEVEVVLIVVEYRFGWVVFFGCVEQFVVVICEVLWGEDSGFVVWVVSMVRWFDKVMVMDVYVELIGELLWYFDLVEW